MEVCEGGEQPPLLLLQWDRKLSELCEPADPDALLGHTEHLCLLRRPTSCRSRLGWCGLVGSLSPWLPRHGSSCS